MNGWLLILLALLVWALILAPRLITTWRLWRDPGLRYTLRRAWRRSAHWFVSSE